jgi:hypothetical protein
VCCRFVVAQFDVAAIPPSADSTCVDVVTKAYVAEDSIKDVISVEWRQLLFTQASTLLPVLFHHADFCWLISETVQAATRLQHHELAVKAAA